MLRWSRRSPIRPCARGSPSSASISPRASCRPPRGSRHSIRPRSRNGGRSSRPPVSSLNSENRGQTPILFNWGLTPIFCSLTAQVRLLDLGVVQEVLPAPGARHLPLLHDVGAVGEFERGEGVLLDHHYGDALGADGGDDVEG